MDLELVPLTFEKIMQSRTYTVIVLASPEKRFAIYADSKVGHTLQLHLTGAQKPRPLTHDLINKMLQGLRARIKQVVITDVEETIYFARIFLEQPLGSMTHIVEIDARPSDCIALALMNKVPLYCTPAVLSKTIALED